MRAIATAAIAIVSLLPSLAFAGNKLSVEDRIELTRGLMAEYKLRSGALFADVTAAPGMVSRGKLGFVPHPIKGVKEVRRIFDACERANQEKP